MIFLNKVSVLDLYLEDFNNFTEKFLHVRKKWQRNVLYSVITNKFPVNQLALSVLISTWSYKVSLTLQNKTFAVTHYVSYAELVPFNNLGLIYYLVDQSLLQIDGGISKWCNFIPKWVKHYYKMGTGKNKVGQSLLPNVVTLPSLQRLQDGTNIRNWDNY